MAHSLKLKVVAEGVETAEQLAFLRSLKCDGMQGYFFSRPLAAEEATKLLVEKKESRFPRNESSSLFVPNIPASFHLDKKLKRPYNRPAFLLRRIV